MNPSKNPGSQVVIAGYAMSKVSRASDQLLGAMALETCRMAAKDAGIAPGDIDGFTTGAMMPAYGDHATIEGRDIVTSNYVASQMGGSPNFVSDFSGLGQLPGSMILAANAVASGAAKYAVVFRALHNPKGGYHNTAKNRFQGAAQWSAPHGFWGPVYEFSLLHNEYVQRYGATREQMADLVVGLRQAAIDLPWSAWRGKALEKADYLASRPLAGPITMHDCDMPVDAVGAFILTSAERARDLPNKPVFIRGFSQARPIVHPSLYPFRTLDEMMEGGAATARKLWASSGMGPKDIDVPQMYDGFSALVYLWLEALGFCGAGEAPSFVQQQLSSDGGLPLATGGGNLGNGRLHGMAQLLEGYLQVSRRAGTRQLAKSRSALVTQAMPDLGGAMVLTDEAG